MSTDRDTKLNEVKAGAAGVALGSLTYMGGQLPLEPSVLDAVTGYGYSGAAALVAGAVAHNRWYFSARQKFLREVHGEGWLDRHDLRNTSGRAALRRQAAQIRPKLEGKGKPSDYGWKQSVQICSKINPNRIVRFDEAAPLPAPGWRSFESEF